MRRDGRWQVINVRQLVPGDQVHVRLGDIVPADLTVTGGAVAAGQSVLTGESAEVEAGPGQQLSTGSLLRQGEATGTVTATGAATYYGRITELVRTATGSPSAARGDWQAMAIGPDPVSVTALRQLPPAICRWQPCCGPLLAACDDLVTDATRMRDVVPWAGAWYRQNLAGVKPAARTPAKRVGAACGRACHAGMRAVYGC